MNFFQFIFERFSYFGNCVLNPFRFHADWIPFFWDHYDFFSALGIVFGIFIFVLIFINLLQFLRN